MYIPTNFEVTDKEEIFSFIEANAFGQLISMVDGRLFSTHLPFLVSQDKTKVVAHLATQNPQHVELQGQEALVTLQGPHDYVSPSWYSVQGVPPTWNYQSVHIYGKCNVFKSADKLQSLVEKLTTKYEAVFDEPWRPNYKTSMLRAIVGVEIEICDIQCKYKLSQNRSPDDRSEVVTQLKAHGSDNLAMAMERNKW